MNRRILVGALVACVVGLFWVLSRSRTEPREATASTSPPATPSERAPDRGPVVPDLAGGETPASAVDSTQGRTEAAAPSATPPVEGVAAKVDKKARDWIHLIVQDSRGAPIANADIRMVGLRTKREPGSHWAWPEEPSIGRTAPDGTAKLWFPVWVTSDDEAGELTFKVGHPDFVTKTVDNFTIGPEPRVVVLERGAFVIVSGWIDAPSEKITDVVPHLTWDVEIAEEAWQRVRDGRLSTANIPIGPHAIYLSHASAEHGKLFSAVTPFTLGDGEQKELHLQLVPAGRLEGKLEDEVPRPVLEGTVLLNLQVGAGAENGVKMLRQFTAPIRADGGFTIADLPPGDGQIIALCEGWASERVFQADPGGAQSTAVADRDSVLATRGEQAFIAQQVDPGTSGVLVLKMEPTASLKAYLIGPDGNPVEGAIVNCWPNVRWLTGHSSVFLDKSWSATSDARGELVVKNVPWGTVWYGISHADLDLPPTNGNRSRQASLEPGKETEIVLDLEVKEK